jgi:hypothetical protein
MRPLFGRLFVETDSLHLSPEDEITIDGKWNATTVELRVMGRVYRSKPEWCADRVLRI